MCVFFFQAEDGIRDHCVTGVQTCALPICKGGRLTSLLKQLGTLPAEERRKQGAALNSLKEEISALIEARKHVLEAAELNARLAQERFDITLPPRPQPQGFIHPITRTI